MASGVRRRRAEAVWGGGHRGRAGYLARPCRRSLAAAVLWVWAVHALWNSTSFPAPSAGHFRRAASSAIRSCERSASYNASSPSRACWRCHAAHGARAVRPHGHLLMRESAAGRIGTGMLLAMLGLAMVWLAPCRSGSPPCGGSGATTSRTRAIWHGCSRAFSASAGSFLFVCLGLAIAMGLAGVLRRWWWAVAAPVFVGLALLFTLVSPSDPEYDAAAGPGPAGRSAAARTHRGTGRAPRCEVQDVHRFTTAPNAESARLRATRTVIMWDTLVNGKFSRPQIRFVIAHEFGHLAHDDPLKLVGWLALFLLPATGLIAFFTRGAAASLARRPYRSPSSSWSLCSCSRRRSSTWSPAVRRRRPTGRPSRQPRSGRRPRGAPPARDQEPAFTRPAELVLCPQRQPPLDHAAHRHDLCMGRPGRHPLERPLN